MAAIKRSSGFLDDYEETQLETIEELHSSILSLCCEDDCDMNEPALPWSTNSLVDTSLTSSSSSCEVDIMKKSKNILSSLSNQKNLLMTDTEFSNHLAALRSTPVESFTKNTCPDRNGDNLDVSKNTWPKKSSANKAALGPILGHNMNLNAIKMTMDNDKDALYSTGIDSLQSVNEGNEIDSDGDIIFLGHYNKGETKHHHQGELIGLQRNCAVTNPQCLTSVPSPTCKTENTDSLVTGNILLNAKSCNGVVNETMVLGKSQVHVVDQTNSNAGFGTCCEKINESQENVSESSEQSTIKLSLNMGAKGNHRPEVFDNSEKTAGGLVLQDTRILKLDSQEMSAETKKDSRVFAFKYSEPILSDYVDSEEDICISRVDVTMSPQPHRVCATSTPCHQSPSRQFTIIGQSTVSEKLTNQMKSACNDRARFNVLITPHSSHQRKLISKDEVIVTNTRSDNIVSANIVGASNDDNTDDIFVFDEYNASLMDHYQEQDQVISGTERGNSQCLQNSEERVEISLFANDHSSLFDINSNPEDVITSKSLTQEVSLPLLHEVPCSTTDDSDRTADDALCSSVVSLFADDRLFDNTTDSEVIAKNDVNIPQISYLKSTFNEEKYRADFKKLLSENTVDIQEISCCYLPVAENQINEDVPPVSTDVFNTIHTTGIKSPNDVISAPISPIKSAGIKAKDVRNEHTNLADGQVKAHITGNKSPQEENLPDGDIPSASMNVKNVIHATEIKLPDGVISVPRSSVENAKSAKCGTGFKEIKAKDVGHEHSHAGEVVDSIEMVLVQSNSTVAKDIIKRWESAGIPSCNMNLTVSFHNRKKRAFKKSVLESKLYAGKRKRMDDSENTHTRGKRYKQDDMVSVGINWCNLKKDNKKNMETFRTKQYLRYEQINAELERELGKLRQRQCAESNYLSHVQDRDWIRLNDDSVRWSSRRYSIAAKKLCAQHDRAYQRMRHCHVSDKKILEHSYSVKIQNHREKYAQEEIGMCMALEQMEDNVELFCEGGSDYEATRVKKAPISNKSSHNIVYMPKKDAQFMRLEEDLYEGYYSYRTNYNS